MNYVEQMVKDRVRELLQQKLNVAERNAAMWKTIAQSLLAGYAVLIVFALIH